jgi:aminoglycoside phosphotransferase (APT) family kinase protein
MSTDLIDGLQRVLSARLDAPDATVESLERLSGGASRQTWAFDLVVEGDAQPLILQLQRSGGVRTGVGMSGESELLSLAADAGVPVAEVLASGEADSDLGAPFIVMRRVVGETIPRKLLRDAEFAAARRVVASQAGTALARLHSAPVTGPAAAALEDSDQVTQFRDLLDLMGEPHPAFELGLRWLDARRPDEARSTVVHGDFRTGNLVIDGDGLQAVLDWELAHRGDPLEDLGWFCVRAWRFGSDLPAGGFGTIDQLVESYESESGTTVDRDALRWWQAMGTLKWGVMCIIQASTHWSGMTRSVELAAIGRRACENEYDLLELIR